MFTFHWSEVLVVVVSGLILFFGLALLILRRRNEILQMFLTPEDPDIEEEFIRLHSPIKAKTSYDDAETSEPESEEESGKDAVHGGTP